MKTPFFSVIMPLYNKENYVEKAIRSILDQTFSDFEIVVVDDCSTDNSLSVVMDMSVEKIRIVSHEKNKGLSASRNTGIKNALAEFVVFLDADDYWKPHFLEKIQMLTEKFPQASLFATAYEEIYPEVVLKPNVNKNDLAPGAFLLISDFFVKNLRQPICNHSSLCVRKNLFDSVGFYDENINFSEDVDFNIRAFSASPLAFYNGIESCYVIYSENQITNSGIKTKKIPTLDQYTALENRNPDLKKYVDFERYVLAAHCKLADRDLDYHKFVAAIDMKNLTLKQRMKLRLPKFGMKLLGKIKTYFLLKGYRMTTY